MKISLAFLSIFLGMFLVACDESATPQTAKGDTPIRYVICSIGDKDCILVARFVDFDSCETHKKVAEMLCDSRSTPGTITCTKILPRNWRLATVRNSAYNEL